MNYWEFKLASDEKRIKVILQMTSKQRIEELEDSITANDAYLQRIEASHAELLAVLKTWRSRYVRNSTVYSTDFMVETDQAIANAEKLK